jgi:hypothetical protein
MVNSYPMEKAASNFELNVIKLGVHTFQLMKGDRFESNGSYFHYVPSKANTANQGKGKRRRFEGRANWHSCLKYQKDVLRADNIELISDELLGTSGNHRMKIWEVQYAFVQEMPKNENLILMCIELDNKYASDESKRAWGFKTQELEVERKTEKQMFLKERDPISHSQRIENRELNIVRVRYGDEYYLFCMMEDYNDMETKLFEHVEKAVKDKIEHGHQIVKTETNNLNKFLLLKSKQGY